MKSDTQRNPASRYLFIDALRGIAALGVVLHHARHNTVMATVYEKHMSGGFEALLNLGALGVPVFFILSGFVIAHSLRNNSLSFKDVGNFMLRRQLRLDPAYWATIVLMLLLLVLETKILKIPSTELPTGGILLANIFYLQGILSLPVEQEIVGVAWTLCLEIQFYIFFLLLLVLGKNGKRIHPDCSLTNHSVLLILATGTICLLIKPFYPNPAWFFAHWFYFALGTLSYYAWKKLIPSSYFVGFSTLFLVLALLANGHEPFTHQGHGAYNNIRYGAMFIGLITAWGLYVAGITNQMAEWGKSKVLQYLGKISYSLYLTHLFVLYIVLKGGYKITGENVVMAYVWGIISIVASVAFAHLFYMLVEGPSLKLAEKFKVAKPQQKPTQSENLAAADGTPALAADA